VAFDVDMLRNVAKNPIKQKREKKRLAKLEKAGRLVKGVEIPEGALPGNPDEQVGAEGYAAKFYYVDIDYVCRGCGRKEVWTAAQQKRYFEVQKGNIYNEPTWCHECHTERMQKKKAASQDSQ
jgi:hypothetical protein